MRLPRTRLLTASAVTLAMGVGTPALLASGASAATSPGSAATAAHSAAAQPAASSIAAPVTGTFKNAAGTGTFAGTFTPTSFKVVNGTLDATGLLKGTLTSADGTSLGNVSQTVTMPVNTGASAGASPAACNVLNLVLGPLNLNLLGLVVTLNQVHLNITAVPGSLLGDLLCDVAHLLDSGGALSSISSLLNSILGNL